MIKKFLTVTAVIALMTAPAFAQVSTFTSNPPTASAGTVTYDSGTDTATATAADGARLYSTTRPIERGEKYRYSFEVTDYVSGGVQPYVGTIVESSVAPTITTPRDTATFPRDPGKTAIADNFTTADGIEAAATQPIQGTPDSDDDIGAFRFFCASGPIKPIDPLVVKGLNGASHMHNFFGNTGVTENSTYESLRRSGGSTCATDQAHPIWRSAYWFPAMNNGKGASVSASAINVYYKRPSLDSRQCTDGPSTRAGICVGMPNGLNMIWGYNMTTMSQPFSNGRGLWSCRARLGAISDPDFPSEYRGPSVGGSNVFETLTDLRNAGTCPADAAIVVAVQAPPCWDGVNLQTADHRSHMTYGPNTNGNFYGTCPVTHPYHVPVITLQIYWDVDPNLPTWRLSSDDQMGMGVKAGETFHTDFMMAAGSYMRSLEENCLDVWRSCSGGQNGIGTALKQGNITASRSRRVPYNRLGLGFVRSKNGTFTGEFTAPANGEFGFKFQLFTGKVRNLTITKITKGARGPVTTTNTQ